MNDTNSTVKSIPPIEEGWKTAAGMRREHGGDIYAWERKMEALRDQMIKDFSDNDVMSRDEARDIVEMNFVGRRIPMRKKEPALAISPAAQKTLLDERAPELKEGWKTGGMMHAAHGGGHEAWDRRIQAYGERLVRDIVEEKTLSREDAEAVVAEHFVARQRQAQGQVAWAASPQAQEQMIEEKEKPPGQGWVTTAMLAQHHGMSERTWSRRIQNLRNTLIADAAGEKEIGLGKARAHVEGQMIHRQATRGNPLVVSPDAAALLTAPEPPKPSKGRRVRNRVSPENADIPLLEEGWKTGSMMARDHGGKYAQWNAAMAEVREERYRELSSQVGVGLRQANDQIEADFIGIRRHKNGGPLTDAASPEAQQRIIAKYREMHPSRGR